MIRKPKSWVHREQLTIHFTKIAPVNKVPIFLKGRFQITTTKICLFSLSVMQDKGKIDPKRSATSK